MVELEAKQESLGMEMESELKQLIYKALKIGKDDPFYEMVYAQPGVASLQLLSDEELESQTRRLVKLDESETKGKQENGYLNWSKGGLQDRAVSLEIVDVIYPCIAENLLETMSHLNPNCKVNLPAKIRGYLTVCTQRKQEAMKLVFAEREIKKIWDKYRAGYQLFARIIRKGAVFSGRSKWCVRRNNDGCKNSIKTR